MNTEGEAGLLGRDIDGLKTTLEGMSIIISIPVC